MANMETLKDKEKIRNIVNYLKSIGEIPEDRYIHEDDPLPKSIQIIEGRTFCYGKGMIDIPEELYKG